MLFTKSMKPEHPRVAEQEDNTKTRSLFMSTDALGTMGEVEEEVEEEAEVVVEAPGEETESVKGRKRTTSKLHWGQTPTYPVGTW